MAVIVVGNGLDHSSPSKIGGVVDQIVKVLRLENMLLLFFRSILVMELGSVNEVKSVQETNVFGLTFVTPSVQ